MDPRQVRALILVGAPWVVLVFAALPLPLWRYLLVLGAAVVLVLAARMD